MHVCYRFPRRIGPEAVLEDAVAAQLSYLFPDNGFQRWAGGSVQVGAGMPDLMLVSWEPRVIALADVAAEHTHILAYLRGVKKATAGTVAECLRQPAHKIDSYLNLLLAMSAVQVDGDRYKLAAEWRNVLPQVVTIEAKVVRWQRAIEQAQRNQIFAHRSFIAVPSKVADRIRNESALDRLGIGVLSVTTNGDVRVVRKAQKRQPLVWTYYFQLARIVANYSRGLANAICCRYGRRTSEPSRL